MLFGLDALGIAKYSKEAILAIPAGFAVGCFSDVFGDSRPAIDKLLAMGKCPAVRVQLSYKSSHSYSKKDFPALEKEAQRWLPLIKKYPAVKWYLSGACEHNLSSSDASILANQISALHSKIIYVNSPLKDNGLIKGYLNEFHGGHAKKRKEPFLFSYDGLGCTNSDVEFYKNTYSNAEIFFFWDVRFNGSYSSGPFVPVPKRKGWPDKNYINSIAYLAKDKGTTKLPGNWIFKTHAENSGNGDPRAEKPVIIVPIKTKQVELRTSTGLVVDTLYYYAPMDAKRWRYYSRNWGYTIAEKAFKLTGSHICSVWVDGKQYGVVCPAFKQNHYAN